MSRRCLALGAALALMVGLLTGCQAQATESTVFAMDTVMSLTVYGGKGEEAVEEATELIYDLQDLLTATDENSPLYALNHAGGAWTDLDGDLLALLSDSKALCEKTGGALDITAYPAVQAWGFISKDYRVPDEAELADLASRIDYAALELDLKGSRARLPEGMEVELGAVAKGYTGDRLAQLMAQLGVESAIFSLGGNVQAVGTKPDGSSWRVAIQDPDGQGNLAIVEVTDKAVVTSGGYQRYFEQDGVTYWHILDPDTAAPARTGLKSVTVIGPEGLVCDGLSTALFVLGEEQGMAFWRDHPELGVELVFVREDGSVAITAGLEDSFTLGDGFTDREVQVLS